MWDNREYQHVQGDSESMCRDESDDMCRGDMLVYRANDNNGHRDEVRAYVGVTVSECV